MSDSGHPYLEKANYKMWNNVEFVTLKEFIYLSNGYKPGPEKELFLWTIDPSNKIFKDVAYELERAGKELSYITQDIEVRNCEGKMPEYPASFLIEWAKKKGFKVKASYKPVKSYLIKEKTSDQRRINSLEKLCLGLALKLGYEPYKKNIATGSGRDGFKDILEQSGINLSEETIRDLLNKASDKHLPKKTK